MRRLEVVPAEPAAVLRGLRSALAGDGPALLPLAPGAESARLPAQVDRRVGLVVQTSGTAGPPKRVALAAEALLASAAATDHALGGPGRWVLTLPVHYIAGLQVLVRSITAGTEPAVVLPGASGPAAFAAAFAAAVASIPSGVRAYTALVPAQLAALLAVPFARRALVRLDAALVGGQRLPEAVRDEAVAAGARIVRSYGSSETSGGCVYDGVPLANVGVRIDGGEVLLAGPMLAEGYLGEPERSAAAFPAVDGRRWYRTGDAGELADGVLSVTGRRDDVIVSGGEKVSLGRVEAVVRELPGCADAVIVAGPSPRWGEVPVLVLAVAGAVELDAVRAAVGRRLGAPARPERIVVVDPLPLLPSGKPDRRALTATVRNGGAS